MTLQEAIKILTDHQQWRLGNDDIPMQIPSEITEALDKVLNHTNEMIELPKQTRKEALDFLTSQAQKDGLYDVREDDVYSEIENAIIVWELDNTRTAGDLTRQLLKIIKENTYTEEQVKEAMRKAKKLGDYSFDQIIQSLKQPKQ